MERSPVFGVPVALLMLLLRVLLVLLLVVRVEQYRS